MELCKLLRVSSDRFSTLIELLRMVSSVNADTTTESKNESKSFVYSKTTKTETVQHHADGDTVTNSTEVYYNKQEYKPIFSKQNSNFEAVNNVIDLGSPSPKKKASSSTTFKTPIRNHRDTYDFFGASYSPMGYDDVDEFEDDDHQPGTDSSGYFNYSTANNTRTSSLMSPSCSTTCFKNLKSPEFKQSTGRPSTSPGGKIDPNTFPVGQFIGKVVNHGTTGEFDGYKYPHSKIMLDVSKVVHFLYIKTFKC